MGKSEKVYYGGCGDRTHDPKNHGLSTTPFVKDFSGVLVSLTTCKRLTNSLPKLSLITVAHMLSASCVKMPVALDNTVSPGEGRRPA